MKSHPLFSKETGYFLSGIARLTLDWFLPSLCPLCRSPLRGDSGLCPACWGALQFISPPFCHCCGAPLPYAYEGEMLCPSCSTVPSFPGQRRAAFIYDDKSRPLILKFKHGDKTNMAPFLARLMAASGADLLKEADLLLPVPLHRWRLLYRRYNQAALLAAELSTLTGVPAKMMILQRVRQTKSQGHGGKKWREANVTGAFALSSDANIKGKRLVLIDDVCASGATAKACAKVLLKAGAAHVDLLTAALSLGDAALPSFENTLSL